MPQEREPATLRHRIEFLGVRAAVAAVEVMPSRAGAWLAARLGDLMHATMRGRVRLAREQMAAALRLEPDSPQVNAAVRGHLRHFMGIPCELVKLPAALRRARPDEILRLVGREHLDRALRAGRGALLVTGHVGNWEMFGALLAQHGIPLTTVARPIDNPLVDAEITRLRARYGQKLLFKNGALAKVVAALARGDAVALATDQHAGRRGMRIPFFHADASTFTFAAELARETGAPFLPAFSRQLASHRVEVAVQAPIEPDLSLPADEDAYRMTLGFHRRLEQAIRAAPSQYLWLHRRWKQGGREPDPAWRQRYASAE
jgi:KDO2-lipid IV(A) lauroyltransferase